MSKNFVLLSILVFVVAVTTAQFAFKAIMQGITGSQKSSTIAYNSCSLPLKDKIHFVGCNMTF